MTFALRPTLFAAGYLCLATTLAAALPWTDTQPNADGIYDIPWFGRVYETDSQGWIYHAELGWLYEEGDSAESLYLYKPELGWLWTGRNYAGYFYDYTSGAWLWHVTGTSSPQWFYNYRYERYVRDYMDGKAPVDLTSVIEEALASSKVPAAACAVVRGGKIVAKGQWGLRRKGYAESVNSSSRWEVASLTKSMTALLAERLIEEGRLNWTDSLGELLPDIPMASLWKNVTFQQLIWHTSGIDENSGACPVNPYGYSGNAVEQRLAFAKAVLAINPTNTPGATFHYSNYGYSLAGFILEHLTWTAYEDLMAEYVYNPLGMEDAGFYAPAKGDARDTETWGYNTGVEADPDANSGANCLTIAPAAGASLSIEALALYAAEHLSGENGAAPLLTDAQWNHLHRAGSTANPDYACGWYSGTYYQQLDDDCLFHEGYSGSFTSMMLLSPDEDLAIVMTANEGNTGWSHAVFDTIAAEVTTHYKEY